MQKLLQHVNPDVNRSFPFGGLSVNNRSWTIDARLRLLMREVDVGGFSPDSRFGQRLLMMVDQWRLPSVPRMK